MDQCLHCLNRGEEDKCYGEECFVLESWIVKHLQLKLREKDTLITDIADLLTRYGVDT